jgi:hypothetical protein
MAVGNIRCYFTLFIYLLIHAFLDWEAIFFPRPLLITEMKKSERRTEHKQTSSHTFQEPICLV